MSHIASPSVYVGSLSPEVTEVNLFDHFKPIGPIVSVRVCTDSQTGKSLGYGYINFQSPADAERAIDERTVTELNGRYIRVWYVERDPLRRRRGDGNVVVKHLPTTLTEPELKEQFSKYGRIQSVTIATRESHDPATRGQRVSNGFGYVQFDSNEAAERALELNGSVLGDDEGAPAIEVVKYNANFQEEKKRSYTNLFIRGLNPNLSPEDAQKAVDEYFSQFGTITSSKVEDRMYPGATISKRIAYVAFADHESAVRAVDETNGKSIENLSDPAPVPEGAPSGLAVGRFKPKRERRNEAAEIKSQRRLEYSRYPNLYVKNIDESVDDAKLREAFSRCGQCISVHVMRDRQTGISRRFGFVSVIDNIVANRCLQELNQSNLLGSLPLYVNRAMKKDSRAAMMAERARRQVAQQQYGMHGQVSPAFFQRPFANPMGPRPAVPMGMPAGMMNPGITRIPQAQSRPPIGGMMQPVAVPAAPVPQPTQQEQLVQVLANVGPEQRKNILGERLYTQVIRDHPEQAAKITGMLLEMDNAEILNLLEDPAQLDAKVAEALDVLQRNQ